MRHVMIDLETLGTEPGCAILSIGAAEFGPDGLKASLYVPINLRSCLRAGLTEDPDTVAWWEKQSHEAKQTLRDSASKTASFPLGAALSQLDFWLGQVCGLVDDAAWRRGLRVYGNGADFDLPILAAACRATGHDVPWAPYAGRCYRSYKNLRPAIKLDRVGVHHNALGDAQSQAEHCARLLNHLGWGS